MMRRSVVENEAMQSPYRAVASRKCWFTALRLFAVAVHGAAFAVRGWEWTESTYTVQLV